ncbi:MAG: hypothetical protein H8E15_14320 [Planctomycetes bacterium]|nr:hypothetical protein [Planctomycetota bacterium]
MRYSIQKLQRLSSMAFSIFLIFTISTIVFGLAMIGMGFVGDFSERLWLAFAASFLSMIVSSQTIATTKNRMSIEKKSSDGTSIAPQE